MIFFCTECQLDFETSKPNKKEYKDYILGPCWKYVSNCPNCGHETNEKIVPKPQKLKISYPQNNCNGDCGCCG